MNDLFQQGVLSHPQVGSVVQEVIQMYELHFSGQIVACYVEGSYADQTSLTSALTSL